MSHAISAICLYFHPILEAKAAQNRVEIKQQLPEIWLD
jgi:hypothetical protein